MSKKTLAIVGSGHLGTVVAEAWRDGYLADYELIYIAGRDAEKAKALADHVGAKGGGDLAGLLTAKPDVVAEAASIAFLHEHAVKILENGSDLVVISVGALADDSFRVRAAEAAKAHGVRIHISNGVTGGFDILRTFSLLGEVDAHFTTHKGPASLGGSVLYSDELMKDTEERVVFDGLATEIIKLLPTRVNVAVASSLAGPGPEKTRATMVSVPGMIGDDHCMVAEVNGHRAVVDIYTSTGIIAGWGIVATLRNMTDVICFS